MKRNLIYILIILNTLVANTQNTANRDYKTIDWEQEGEIGKLMQKAISFENLDSTVIFCKEVLALSKTKKDTSLMASALKTLGDGHYHAGNYVLARESASNLLDLVAGTELVNFKSRAYKILGNTAKRLRQRDLAHTYYERAMEYAISRTDSMAISLNIGTLYLQDQMRNVDLAKPFLEQALAHFKTDTMNTPPYYFMASYNGLAWSANDYETGLKYLDSMGHYADRLNSGRKGIYKAMTNNQISGMHYRFERHDLAIKGYKKSLEMSKDACYGENIGAICRNLAEIYYSKLQDQTTALKYLDSLEYFSKKYDFKLDSQSQSDTIRYIVYAKTGNYKKAYQIAKQRADFLNEQNKDEYGLSYVEYGRMYKADLKEKENEILKQDAELKELLLMKQRSSRNSFIGLFVFAGVLSIVLYRRYQQKQEVAIALEEKNKIIDKQKGDLEEALTISKTLNKELETANRTRDKLFGIISHDLINPFNTVLGYTYLLETDYDKFTEAERKEFITSINQASTRNYNLVKNLLDWAKQQQDRITINKIDCDVKELIQDAISPYMEYAKKKGIKLNYHIDYKNLHTDKDIVKTVIGNLFYNAVKFTKTNGAVEINARLDKHNRKAIVIKDQGIGMEPEKVKKLFNLETHVTTSGTNDERGSGLGLIICKEFIELLEGSMSLFSEKNKGTTITLSMG